MLIGQTLLISCLFLSDCLGKMKSSTFSSSSFIIYKGLVPNNVVGEYLDSETIVCVNGYVLVGSPGTPSDVTYHIICEASGVWSADTGCQRE